MAYQALYRQWRPAAFSEMVGQEHIVNAFRNQVETGRIAHAYLFCGSRGTGKTSSAKILARAINCEHPDHGDPCGVCESCRRLQAEESLDVIEIDAASNNGVDEIRDLRETVQYPPQHGRYKVYIIDEVHMLSASAFNALLKTLEEPPAHAVFILATTEPQKLPATILSRCQRYDFGRIPAEQIAGRLREAAEGAGGTATDGALRMIARAAEGGMRDALSILDMCLGYGRAVDEELVRSVLGTSDRAFLFRFAESLQEQDAAALMALIDETMRRGREPVVFAKDVSRHLRALLLAKACPERFPDLTELTAEDAEDYIGQADGFTEMRLLSMLELFMAVETELRYASSPRIALEKAALRACLRTGEDDTAALRDRIAELEKSLREVREQLANGAAAAPAARPAAKAPAPEKPASAQPERPKNTQMPSGRTSDAVWKEACGLLRKANLGLSSMLAMGRYVGSDGTVYRWQMDKPNAAIEGILRREESVRQISELLTQVSGVESRFEVAPGDAPAFPDAEDPLRDWVATFGRENVEVQEDR